MQDQSILENIVDAGKLRADLRGVMARLSTVRNPTEKLSTFLDRAERIYVSHCYEAIARDRKKRTEYENLITDLKRQIKVLKQKNSQVNLFGDGA